jgi:hypothetical protein
MIEENHSFSNVIFLLLLIVFLAEPVFPQIEKELTLKKYYFPKDDEPFFKRGNDIEIVDNAILVIENPKHHVLKYTVTTGDELEFKGFVTQKGLGPGDTFLPVEMHYLDEKLVIADESSFSFFSKDLKFLSKFRKFSGGIPFVYTGERIFYANRSTKNRFLIDVYSRNGKKLFQCGGNPLNIDYDIHKGVDRSFVKGVFYKGKLVSDGHSIFYFNQLFGKVFVFDLQGKQVKETSIVSIFDPKMAKEILRHNNALLKEGIKRNKNNKVRVVTSPFFRDIYLCKNKIYILDNHYARPAGDFIKIMVLEKNSLELEHTFLIKKDSNEDRIRSMAVKEVNGRAVIFAAMNTEDGTVIAKFKEQSP